MPPSNYQLYPTAQAQPRFQNSPKGNAKSDGEAAINTLTCVTKKWIRVETGGTRLWIIHAYRLKLLWCVIRFL